MTSRGLLVLVAAVASDLGSPDGTPPPPRVTMPVPPRKPAEAIDLLGTAGAPVLKRLAPLVAGLLVLAWLLRRLAR